MSAQGRPRTARGPALVAVAATALATRGLYGWLVSGALALDTGIGRRVVELGPITVHIEAPREVVFDVIAAPYLGRAGSAADHIDVLDRGEDLVVAAHHTSLGGGRVATTVEAVGFDRPREITFRLLRGPVPHVRERFELEEDGEATRFRYTGELGTDFWGPGAWWGSLVRRTWERTVATSVEDVRRRSEERAAAHRRRAERAHAPGGDGR